MVKAIVGILPWAVVLVAAGAAIWWLLSRDMAAGRWLLAGLLIGHGLVHVMFFMPTPSATAGAPEWPFDIARSWPVTGAGLDLSLVRAVGLALVAVVVVAFGLAALSTLGIVVPSDLWPAITVAGAIASAVVLGLFFEPQLILGLGIDAVLIGVVVTRAWTA